MRIRVLSDLHEEFRYRFGALELPRVEAAVTVLAGDIANGLDALEVARRDEFAGSRVLLVPGNHEYYDSQLESMRLALRHQAASLGRVHLLDEDSVVVDGVRFVGTTLWTDYLLDGPDRRDEAMSDAARYVLDHRKIRLARGGFLSPADALALHGAARDYLRRVLAEPFPGPTVVISHHAPHPGSIAPRFEGNPVNPAFVNDLGELLARADLWIHGHTHDSFDYRVGRARVVANPAGYRSLQGDRSGEPQLVFENARFDPGLVVELASR